jgi:hypothetical protein
LGLAFNCSLKFRREIYRAWRRCKTKGPTENKVTATGICTVPLHVPIAPQRGKMEMLLAFGKLPLKTE